jgi:hypothetical protein
VAWVASAVAKIDQQDVDVQLVYTPTLHGFDIAILGKPPTRVASLIVCDSKEALDALMQ